MVDLVTGVSYEPFVLKLLLWSYEVNGEALWFVSFAHCFSILLQVFLEYIGLMFLLC